MAAPQKMEREGVAMTSAAPLLQGVTSITFGPAGMDPHKYFQGQGAGPFGMPAKGLAGSTPLTSQDGTLIATLKFSSSNIGMGQLSAQLILPNGTIVAQIERANRTNTFAQSADPMTVAIDGAPYATVDSGPSGSLQREGSGRITFETPSWQPASKWCAVAFCCFIPTAGIAACIAAYMSEKAGRLVNLTSIDGAPPLKFASYGNPAFTTVVLDFAEYSSLDESSKLDLVLLVACRVCADHTTPGGGGPH